MLDVERDEIDRLPLALDAVEHSGEVPGKAEPDRQLVPDDEQIRQLAGKVGDSGAQGC